MKFYNAFGRCVVGSPITFDEARVEILDEFFEDEDLLKTILERYSSEMRADDFFRVLGDFWMACNHITRFIPELLRMKRMTRRNNKLMTFREYLEVKALPRIVTIYRGTDAEPPEDELLSDDGVTPRMGCCWTTSWDVANSFIVQKEFYACAPVVLTATVAKKNIIAYKCGRGEYEVITFKASVIKQEPQDLKNAMTFHKKRVAARLGVNPSTGLSLEAYDESLITRLA